MANRRTKSAADIREQAYRISKKLMLSGYDAVQRGDYAERARGDRRMRRVLDASDRYVNNISRRLENRTDGNMTNSSFRKQVGRSTYMGLNGG